MGETVTISTARYPLSALIYIAEENAYFAAEGLTVRLRDTVAGKMSIAEVLSGEADLGGAADTAVMYAVASAPSLAIIATLAESDGENALIGRKDRGISGFGDLKGKRVGLSKGTTSQYYFDRLLVELGIPEREVDVVDVGPAKIVAALKTGKVDAVVTWNPWLARTEAALGANAARLERDGLTEIIWTLVGKPDYVRSHPATIKRVLRALVRAERELLDHPDAARRVVARHLGIDHQVLDRAWPSYHFEVALDQSLIVMLEEQSRWAIRRRQVAVTTTPNFLAVIEPSYLQEVRPQTVQIVR